MIEVRARDGSLLDVSDAILNEWGGLRKLHCKIFLRPLAGLVVRKTLAGHGTWRLYCNKLALGSAKTFSP